MRFKLSISAVFTPETCPSPSNEIYKAWVLGFVPFTSNRSSAYQPQTSVFFPQRSLKSISVDGQSVLAAGLPARANTSPLVNLPKPGRNWSRLVELTLFLSLLNELQQ